MTTEELQQIQGMIDQAINTHFHTGTHRDGKRLNGKSLLKAPQEAIADITGTADGTYSGTEQNLINDHTDAINAIITTLRNLGFIRS